LALPSRAAPDFSYDNTEVLIGYRVTGFEADGSTPRYRTFYYVDHHKADSYLAGNEVVNTQSEDDPTVSGSLTRSYNVNNELVSVVDDKNHTKSRFFANNAEGQAMVVVQGDLPTSIDRQVAFSAVLSGSRAHQRAPAAVLLRERGERGHGRAAAPETGWVRHARELRCELYAARAAGTLDSRAGRGAGGRHAAQYCRAGLRG
jgi:hypothetical protein